MDSVRIGIVGLGNMGALHAAYLAAGAVKGATLAAVCDVDDASLQRTTQRHNVPGFSNHPAMFRSGLIDAAMVVTPHYDHPPTCMDAFAAGLHVMSEKPLAVSITAARALAAAAGKFPQLVFGIMFNQRWRNLWQKMREIVIGGELGEITRITWIATDWFRTWTYYASNGWRATWAGEGGGVLINQCPHNLDLLQWITGMMPTRITAVASIGKTHPIEVEDEVSAVMEYPNGAIGHFLTTTGEAPGTNRLEIAGDRGRLVAEDGTLHFRRTRHSVRQIREQSPLSFVSPEVWNCSIPVTDNSADDHRLNTQNWVDAILTGSPLLCPGVEGVRGLEIGNAMLMSGITRQPVDLPIDGAAFDALLKDLSVRYGGKKTPTTRPVEPADMSASFGNR
jgi:predicted dehydrogenase